MMNYRLARLIMICTTALLLAQSQFGFPHRCLSPSVTQSQWIGFVPQDEDLTAMIPAGPTMRNYPIYNSPYDKREKVLAHHEYSGYGDGLIFIVHSYKAEHPEKLVTSQLNLADLLVPFKSKLDTERIRQNVNRGAAVQEPVS